MARTRLKRQPLVCGLLALLVSLLSFAGVLQAGRWRLPGAGGTDTRTHAPLTIWLVKNEAVGRVLEPAAADRPEIAPIDMHSAADTPIAQKMIGLTPVAYVPAAGLSERPLLIQDIDDVLDLASAGIADPDLPTEQQVVALLLINERGGVDRLQFETDLIPRYLEAMLAQRFADARFLPGKIDGRPVRSALRIALRWQ